MSFISSIQSFLPRPDNRSREEIAHDLDDEFAFHLEMKARALQSEEGLEHEAACGLARARFGDIERIRKDCQRIALRERLMLQRVNLVLMIVVTLLVIGVGAQVMITQRYNTLALQAITADLARMKFQDLGPAAPSAAVAPFVYIDGDVQRPGVFALPPVGTLTLSRAITASGGVRGADSVKVTVHGNDAAGKSIVRFISDNYSLKGDLAKDYVLEPNDRIVVTAIQTTRASPDPRSNAELPDRQLAGRWVQVDANRQPLASGATMHLLSRDDVKNVNSWPIGTLQVNADLRAGTAITLTLNFLAGAGGSNLQIKDAASGRMEQGRWEYRDSQLLLNIAPAVPEISEPITLMHESVLAAGGATGADVRAAAVGDFVVRLFALADPNDPNLNQKIREFLDAEEKAADQKYASDPAIAGMIKELIAARRKIFESDEAIQRAATAEEKTRAVSEFLQDVLASTDTAGPTIKLSDVLDNASKRIDEQFADNPELAAQMRQRIAEAKRGLPPADGAASSERDDDDEFPTLSPFEAVRWKDYTPFVSVNGTWGELMSINDVPIGEIIHFCRTTYQRNDRKRFTEDLVQAMSGMGKPVGMTVKLQIKDVNTGTVMSIEQATMTEENWRALWEANTRAADTEAGYPVWTGEPA